MLDSLLYKHFRRGKGLDTLFPKGPPVRPNKVGLVGK